MKNQPQQSKPATKKPRRFIKIAIICGVILVAITAIDIFTVAGGNIRYYAKWVECGERPYRRAALPAGIPYYQTTPVFSLFRNHHVYYCNPLEAEKAGISASQNQYEFPVLKEQGLPPPRVGF